MPCLRGIEVFLTTKPDDERIPEYPHPEGTSAKVLNVIHRGQASSLGSHSQTSHPNSPTTHRKTDLTVSVYIPSVPGTPFAINYSIHEVPPAPCKYLFFRLYVNGRPITAWGIDPNVRPKGKVAKSLWAPCARYNDQVGFEGRNFVFLPGQEYKSVAEDGGLIEIQVFREMERRPRAPRLEEFRFQDNYGIAAPSIGLLDQLQDACFHDWHLLDARDSPFASFKLHYRSWKNLAQLSLIPGTELELLHSASPRSLECVDTIKPDSGALFEESDEESCKSETADEAIFHDFREELGYEDEIGRETSHCFLNYPPELFPATSLNQPVPQPRKALRDGSRESYLQRPLPELPREELRALSRGSSIASAVSATVSITPSLLQDIDEGSFNPEAVEVGVAQVVHLQPSESCSNVALGEATESANPTDYSISDYEISPCSTTDSFSDRAISPGGYLPTTGSGLEHGLAIFTPPKRQACLKTMNSTQALPGGFPFEYGPPGNGAMAWSEPERMSQSPSAARIRAANAAARRAFSRPDGPGGRSLVSGLGKKLLSASPRKLAAMIIGRQLPKPATTSNLTEERVGNWI